MACEYRSPIGDTSEMYAELNEKYGAALARRTFVFVNSPVFKEYALPLNGRGEYDLTALEDAGVIAEIKTIILPFTGKAYNDKQVERLSTAFDNLGIPVEVREDATLETTAEVVAKDGNFTISYNPNAARKDSIFHEFGHILVDSIGYDSEVVQAGISQLRDGKLWRVIRALYPELAGAALEKEVLTTAIGIEAAKYMRGEDLNRWKFWLNTFLRKVGEFFGVTPNVAKDLAMQLVSGNITEKLQYYTDMSVQHQKDFTIINDVFATKYDFIKKLQNQVQKKIAIYYGQLSEAEKAGNLNYQELEALSQELDKFAQLDADEGLIAFLFEALDQTAKLEKRMGQLLHPTAEDIAAGRNVVDAATIQKVTSYNTLFSLIEDLVDIVENDRDLKTKLEDRRIKDSSLYSQIQNIHARYISVNKNATRLGLKYLGEKLASMGRGRVEAMEREKLEKEYNRVNDNKRKEAAKDITGKAGKTYREERRKWINAKIAERKDEIAEKEGERYKSILQQTRSDIGWLERMFLDGDAINDDIIQLGSELLDDADYSSMRSNIDAYKDMNELFNEYEKVYSSDNMQLKYDMLIADEYEVNPVTGVRTKTGKKARRLVSQYLYEFETTRKQLWDTYYQMVDDFGDRSDEALDALKAAQQFTLENTKSRFNAKYHSIINSLPETAERAVKPLKAERRTILAKYKVFRFEDGRTAEIYDMADITVEDANRLDEIAKELNGIASTYTNTGEQKTGEALLIANQLSDYNKRVQELYEEQGVADTAFEARKAKIEERSPEQLADWLKKNQQETLTDEFWDTFNSIIAALGSTDISNTIKNLIKPFKKADGSVDTEAIPADVLKKIRDAVDQRLEDRLQKEADYQEAAFANRGKASVPSPFADMIQWLEDNVKYEPTEAYYAAVAAAKANGTFDAWENDNHDMDGNPLPIWTTITSPNPDYVVIKPKKSWVVSKVKDEYINPAVSPDEDGSPTDAWINPQWAALQADRRNGGVASKMYDKLVELIEESDAGLPEWAKLKTVKKGVVYYNLPSVTKKGITEIIGEQGVMGYVSSQLERFKKGKDDEGLYGSDKEDGTTGSENADEVEIAADPMKRILQVVANERGEQKQGVPINLRFAIKDEEQSFDLPSIFLLNQYMAHNFRNKSDVIADLELMRDFLQKRDVQETSGTFFRGIKHLTDRFADRDKTADEAATPIVKKGVSSNSFAAFQSMLEDRAYGLSSRSGYQVNKIVGWLTSYTGNVMLIGNYLSAGANLLMGEATNWLGALGGRFYSSSDLARASWKYAQDIPTMVGDFGARTFKSKTNLLMERFNAVGDWGAVANRFVDDTRFKQLFKAGTLHAMSNSVEHTIQNTLMYAILNNIKVIGKDGKYLTATGTTDNINEAMSLDEAYKIENGRLVLDERVEFTTDNEVSIKDDPRSVEFLLSRKMRDLNAYLQGQYSAQKRSEIQRSWYGVLIMALRKWMPRGYAYRMRGVDNIAIGFNEMTEDDRFHSRALDGYMEGYYTTAGRFIIELIRDFKDMMMSQTSIEGKKSLRKIAGENWTDLTDWQQSNVIRTVYEMGMVVATMAFAYAMKGLGDDEKDEAAKKMYFGLAFYSLRLSRELSTFINPLELANTLRTPSVVLGMTTRILVFLQQLGVDTVGILTGEGAEVYKSGRRKGELKLEKKFEDIVPLIKNFDRDVQEAVEWFMTRRVY